MTALLDLAAFPLLTVVDAAAGAALPCLEADPELFFAESPGDIEVAKQLCQPCPLRVACLAGALQRREPHGVWGGELLVDGLVVARKRPRGRPRKLRPEEQQAVVGAEKDAVTAAA